MGVGEARSMEKVRNLDRSLLEKSEEKDQLETINPA
jgi:hypothetical protein